MRKFTQKCYEAIVAIIGIFFTYGNVSVHSNRTPRVSIIVPVYNVEQYLAERLG